MRAYLSILRPLNCGMAAFAVVIGAMIAGGPFLIQAVLLAAIAAFLICGAGNAVNDYFDLEIDRVNNPARPIPSGRIAPDMAYKYSLFLFLIGILASVFINTPAFSIAFFNSALLYLYARSIKRQGGIRKNLTVSYLVASPFLFGGVAVESPIPTLFLVFVAFLVNTSREIVKDIEDYEGDKEHLESLPIRFGFRVAALISSTFLATAIFLSILPPRIGIVGYLYKPFIGAADLLLVYSMLLLMRSPRESSGRAQRLIKIAMVLALLGFFLGSF